MRGKDDVLGDVREVTECKASVKVANEEWVQVI